MDNSEETTGVMTSTFSVKTDVFEGPLELLIELIEKRKLLVNDISIAAVTDEYMERVALMEQSNLHETTQFVVLASTLLLIKSKSLLPILELTEEEEDSIEDLQERLKLYQVYRNAGKMLESVFGKQMLFERSFVESTDPIFVTDAYTEKDALAEALKDVLTRLPRKVEKPKVQVRKTISLEEMMENLRTRIEKQMKFNFTDLAGKGAEKGTVIVGFLAVLEMVKQGMVIVQQAKRYEDIEIERESSGTPRYM